MTKIRSTDASNIDDRRGDSGGAGGGGGFPFPFPSGGGGGGGLPFPTKAGGGLMTILLLLAAMFLPKILGRSHQAVGPMTANQAPAQSSTGGGCQTDLEQIVCGVTNDVQQFWTTALPEFFNTQYQMTRTVWFTDSTNTGCGPASSQTGPFYCPNDQLVYLDLGFMQQLEQMLVGNTSDLAEQYIVAHEYGHHIQNLLGTNAQVQQAQQQDQGNANKYSIALELQADCYAGVWVGDVNQRGLLDNPQEITEALKAAEAVGDDRIQMKTQGGIDRGSWTHGSAAQREQWFKRGFDTQDPRQCNTFNEI